MAPLQAEIYDVAQKHNTNVPTGCKSSRPTVYKPVLDNNNKKATVPTIKSRDSSLGIVTRLQA